MARLMSEILREKFEAAVRYAETHGTDTALREVRREVANAIDRTFDKLEELVREMADGTAVPQYANPDRDKRLARDEIKKLSALEQLVSAAAEEVAPH